MQQNPDTANIAVINQAAGGNRILADGLGPNALGRIDRDVLSHSGVKYAMIFEGVNDIGTADATPQAQTAIGDQIIAALQQISTRIHAVEIPIFAATITPFNGSLYNDPTGAREATRQRVNNFIKTSGAFEAVIDFDAILKDPQAPQNLNPAFSSGDGLHPNVAGYQRIADAFPLDIFTKFKDGVTGFT
jgi:lysophospholipase L1-like esterase